MSKLPSRRGKDAPGPLAKVLKLIALARLAFRAFRVYKRARPAIRLLRFGLPAAIVLLVVRRLRARGHAPQAAPYSPPEPPSDNGLSAQTATERNLEAEKN